VLGRLIEQIGLHDAAELVALASTEQLSQIFDEDLWASSRAGEDPRFESGRFLLWLEIMLEAGERFVADRLAELPIELVTLALHRHVLVLSLDDLRDELTADDDEAAAAEKAFESCLSEEIDDYQLIWRGGDGWDDLWLALLALDRDHHEILVELLERCATLSRQHMEDEGGLYAVLSGDEMLEGDLSAARETRRAEVGFVAPSAGAGFLRLALGRASLETPFTEHDPLTRGYFRDLASPPSPARPGQVQEAAPDPAFVGMLREAGVLEPARPRLTGEAGARDEPLVVSALRALADAQPALFDARCEELAYLSNVLVAGATVSGRRLRPVDGVEHALDCVSLGLALVARAEPAAGPVLARYPCDGLFRLALARAAEKGLAVDGQIPRETLKRVRGLLKTIKV
jgi:Family of unknown function (DUF6178)